MQNGAIKLLQEALPDLSPGELRVLRGVAVRFRVDNVDRGGLLKFWSSIFLLMEAEADRRRQVMKQHDTDVFGPVVTEWTGDPKDDANA